MTKQEKAVLNACQKRLAAMIKDYGCDGPKELLTHPKLKARRGVAANLIRACCRWQISKITAAEIRGAQS